MTAVKELSDHRPHIAYSARFLFIIKVNANRLARVYRQFLKNELPMGP